MRLATFNANSIRVRLDAVLEWIAEHEPDVLAIQETKVDDANFPREAIEDAGYQVVFHGQKTHYGVALISKMVPADVRMGMMDATWPDDKRILAATYGDVRVINTYVPNGTQVGSEKFDYKLRWFEQFREELALELQQHSNLVWLGDINVAPTSLDVFDSEKMLGKVCHHPEEMSRLQSVIELGLIDCFRKFNQDAGQFTYWEFFLPKAFERNLGWRIDHIYASPSMASRCVGCEVDRGPRAEVRPSDHTFVFADFTE